MADEPEELRAALEELVAFQLERQDKALALLDALREAGGADEGRLDAQDEPDSDGPEGDAEPSTQVASDLPVTEDR